VRRGFDATPVQAGMRVFAKAALIGAAGAAVSP
jgi:hypothetical protein